MTKVMPSPDFVCLAAGFQKLLLIIRNQGKQVDRKRSHLTANHVYAICLYWQKQQFPQKQEGKIITLAEYNTRVAYKYKPVLVYFLGLSEID